jgi:hypothetical protein
MNLFTKPQYVAYTKAGVPIRLLEGPANQMSKGGQHYRRCQLLPAVPQRFEWINHSNIVARKGGE